MTSSRAVVILLLLAAAAASCGRDAPERPAAAPERAGSEEAGRRLAGQAARVGVEPVPLVYLAENNSDALVRWATHGVRDRIVVHFDGHIDFNWLPPETIDSVRAADDEAALRAIETHPYDLTAGANRGFGIWNYIYAAARTGRVRREVWIVPDGSLPGEAAFEALRSGHGRTLSGVSIEELRGLRFRDGVVTGTLIGVPITIAELDNLPRFDEPVLLDIDLDYFTTVSPVDQRVRLFPTPDPDRFMEVLRERGLSTDLATICYSTVGGYMPYEARWLGPQLAGALRDPEALASEEGRALREGRAAALRDLHEGRPADAVRRLRALSDRHGSDGPLEAALAAGLRAAGSEEDAAGAEARARELDPLAGRLDLYRADVARLNDRLDEAIGLYRRFLEARPEDDPAPYALRRIGFCQLTLGRSAQAVETFRELLVTRPDHADSRYSLAEAMMKVGDLRGAIAEQERALRLRPFDADYSWQLGSMMLQARNPAGAEAHLRRAVEGKPTFPAARYNLAVCLGALGRIDEALAQAQLAVELRPDAAGFQRLLRQLEELARRQADATGTG